MDRGRAPNGIGHLMIARPKDGLFRLHASWIYLSYGYAPVIRLKMAISGRHAHIHTDKNGYF